jgi:hypothetical protein
MCVSYLRPAFRKLTSCFAQLHDELAHLEDRRNRLVDQLKSLNSQILSSHSSQTPGNAAAIGMVMQRRVSDFIRMHPGKAQHGMDSPSTSRRAVSGKISPIDEEESEDPVLSADLLKAFKRQRSADKQSHSILLARLAEAEASARQVEQMKREVDALRQCLETETARSEGLMKQLAGRELLESKQSEEMRRLRSEINEAQTQLVNLKTTRPTLSGPSSSALLNDLGLPTSSQDDQPIRMRNGSMSDSSLPSGQPQCPDCQRYIQKAKAQETIIQGQQSVNHALMGRVADWQKVCSSHLSSVWELTNEACLLLQRVLDQDDLIQRLLPRLQIQEKENAFQPSPSSSPVKTTVDKNPGATGRNERHQTGSPYKPRAAPSPSKASLYSGLGPRPLPMSETQQSNFSPKTHRRVTIEHDIDRLQSEFSLSSVQNTKLTSRLCRRHEPR